jgi:hypothetical protein
MIDRARPTFHELHEPYYESNSTSLSCNNGIAIPFPERRSGEGSLFGSGHRRIGSGCSAGRRNGALYAAVSEHRLKPWVKRRDLMPKALSAPLQRIWEAAGLS